MDDVTLRLRVEHAFLRSELLRKQAQKPISIRRSRFIKTHVPESFGYKRAGSSVKRTSFVFSPDEEIDAVRLAFYESRERLYERLAGTSIDDDCGCGE